MELISVPENVMMGQYPTLIPVEYRTGNTFAWFLSARSGKLFFCCLL
jgi:hypothetical protein